MTLILQITIISTILTNNGATKIIHEYLIAIFPSRSNRPLDSQDRVDEQIKENGCRTVKSPINDWRDRHSALNEILDAIRKH